MSNTSIESKAAERNWETVQIGAIAEFANYGLHDSYAGVNYTQSLSGVTPDLNIGFNWIFNNSSPDSDLYQLIEGHDYLIDFSSIDVETYSYVAYSDVYMDNGTLDDIELENPLIEFSSETFTFDGSINSFNPSASGSIRVSGTGEQVGSEYLFDGSCTLYIQVACTVNVCDLTYDFESGNAESCRITFSNSFIGEPFGTNNDNAPGTDITAMGNFIVFPNDEPFTWTVEGLEEGFRYIIDPDSVTARLLEFKVNNITNEYGTINSVKLATYFAEVPWSFDTSFDYSEISDLPLKITYKPQLDGVGVEHFGMNFLMGKVDYDISMRVSFEVIKLGPIGGDNTGGDNTGGDNTGGDNTGGDNTGGDNTGGDNTGGDNTGGGNTGGGNTGGGNTGGDNSGGSGSGSGSGTGGNTGSGSGGVPSTGQPNSDASKIQGWYEIGGYDVKIGDNLLSEGSATFHYAPVSSSVVVMQSDGVFELQDGSLNGTYGGDTEAYTKVALPFGGLVNEFKEPSSITDFAGTVNGDVNVTGSEQGTLDIDLSGASGTTKEFVHSKVINGYQIDVPIEIFFGENFDGTLDGSLQYPMSMNFGLMSGSNFDEYFSVAGQELELYDSSGNRVNATISVSEHQMSSSVGQVGVALNVTLPKRYVRERITGTARLFVTYGYETYGDNTAQLGLDVVFNYSTQYFDDECNVIYFAGNVSEQEVLTYNKPGSFVENEDGTLTWQEGEEVTEYVTSKEQVEQSNEAKAQTGILRNLFEKITEFFGGFFDNLKETVIGLIVPSDEEMQALLDELMTFFSDKFGFLFYPFEFLGQAVQIFMQDGTTALTFPSFSIMGYEVWPDLTYDITENEIANTVFTYVRYATGAILAMAFVNYLRNFFDKRFGGGGN